MPITKPMLAGHCTDVNTLTFPVLCTPKLDGIRCVKVGGQALSRKFKPIPNNYIRTLIEMHFPDGVDGELICPGKTFHETTSAVMSVAGRPEFQYHVFDYVKLDTKTPYEARMNHLRDVEKKVVKELGLPMVAVLPAYITTVAQLDNYEAFCLGQGYEGVMIRSMRGPYKLGRSTEKEGYLLKLKRFADAEAVIIGLEEKQHNSNEATKDELGHTKRSSHKAGMVPMGTLGALQVKNPTTGQEFSIGTGMNDALRKELWAKRGTLLGKLVKYKHQPSGAKELPRFPVFLGIRDPADM